MRVSSCEELSPHPSPPPSSPPAPSPARPSKVSRSRNSVNYLDIRNYEFKFKFKPQMSCVQSKGFQSLRKASRLRSTSSAPRHSVVFTRCSSMLSAVATTSCASYRLQNFSFSITCAQPLPFEKSTQKYLIWRGICFCSPPRSLSMRSRLRCVVHAPSTSSSACLKKKGRSSAFPRGSGRHSRQMCELSRLNCSKKTTCRSTLSKAWIRHFLQLLSSVRMSSSRPMLVCSWSTGAKIRWNIPSNVLYLASARQTQLEALSSVSSSLSGQYMQYSCTRLEAMIGRPRFFISLLTPYALSPPSKHRLQSKRPPTAPSPFPPSNARFLSAYKCPSKASLPVRKSRKHYQYSCMSRLSWGAGVACCSYWASLICAALMLLSSTVGLALPISTCSCARPFLSPLSISFSYISSHQSGSLGRQTAHTSSSASGTPKALLLLQFLFSSLTPPHPESSQIIQDSQEERAGMGEVGWWGGWAEVGVNINSHNKSSQMRALLSSNRFCFSKDLFLSGANPIRERVMSTPTWPVPYYQRLTKAYPIREQTKPNLGGVDLPADDSTWLSAKYLLNQSAKGRQIVSYTEQHIKTESYLIKKDDCETMARAYVNDIAQFLDVTNKENVKILKGKTLL